MGGMEGGEGLEAGGGGGGSFNQTLSSEIG